MLHFIVSVGNILFLWNIILRGIIFAVIVEKCYMWVTVHINTPLPPVPYCMSTSVTLFVTTCLK